MGKLQRERVVGILICPDTPDVVTVVRCELCETSFAAAGGIAENAALLMLASHVRAQHRISDARAEEFDLEPAGNEREVWLCK